MTMFCLALLVLPAAAWAAGTNGKTVYAQTCSGCHGGDAEGVPGSYPRLRGRVSHIAESSQGRKYLISAVSFGLFGSITVDDQPIMGVMPPHPQLSDPEIAAVLNYLSDLNSPKNAEKAPFDVDAVKQVRAKPRTGSQVHKLRTKVLKSASDGSAGDSGNAASESDSTSDQRLAKLRDTVADYRIKARNTFQLHCGGCHGFDGKSPTPAVPTLRSAVGYFPHLPRGREFLGRVPGVSMSMLDDEQTAQVLNWLLLTFSADQLPDGFTPYTAPEVRTLREHPLTTESDRVRAEIVSNLRERGITVN